ncbi:MAG: hypothetical protein OES26_17065 [Gammaproteobacteria bacterium]|nr:hypothetical protein [Gammaproteobacteria bacterium]
MEDIPTTAVNSFVAINIESVKLSIGNNLIVADGTSVGHFVGELLNDVVSTQCPMARRPRAAA